MARSEDGKPARCRNCSHCIPREDDGLCTEHLQRVRLNAVCPSHPMVAGQQKLFRAEHVVGLLGVTFE